VTLAAPPGTLFNIEEELQSLLQIFLLGHVSSYIHLTLTVLHSKSGLVPRSSLSGAGQLGFWEIGKGGTIG
jgi:hypothetical protein